MTMKQIRRIHRQTTKGEGFLRTWIRKANQAGMIVNPVGKLAKICH